MQNMIKFTVEQLAGAYFHLSSHSTYTLNYFLQKNLIGYYMNFNLINLNHTYYLMRGSLNLMYYFMLHWRWRPMVLVPSLALNDQLVKILNKLKISYIFGKWSGGFLSNFKKMFLSKGSKRNSWFKYMPKFCITVGTASNAESIVEESNILALVNLLFSDNYVNRNENFTYLTPVGTSSTRSRLFVVYLLLEIYKKLLVERSRVFWAKIRRYIEKENLNESGRRHLQYIFSKKCLFGKYLLTRSNGFFNSQQFYKLIKKKIEYLQNNYGKKKITGEEKVLFYYRKGKKYLDMCSKYYKKKKSVDLLNLPLNKSILYEKIMRSVFAEGFGERIKPDYACLVDLRAAKLRKSKLFSSLLLSRTALIRRKWTRRSKHTIWSSKIVAKLKEITNGIEGSADYRRAVSLMDITRRNYILTKQYSNLFNNLFTLDLYTRINVANKLFFWYRLIRKARLLYYKNKAQKGHIEKQKQKQVPIRYKFKKFKTGKNRNRGKGRYRTNRRKLKKNLNNNSKQIKHYFVKLKRRLKWGIMGIIRSFDLQTKKNIKSDFQKILRLKSLAAVIWLRAGEKKKKNNLVTWRYRLARLRRFGWNKNIVSYYNLLLELLPRINIKNKSRKKVKSGIDSVIDAIKAAEEEERRRVLAAGMSEEEYNLKTKADEEESKLIANLFVRKTR